jgi:hypothetical protein
VVHTLEFVRNRSSFLFTTLLAFTAVFLPETASLAKRLLIHRRYLAEQVIVKKFRSVEIVLAFMVSIPWMPPGLHATDDDTSLYLATALSIALDLSLDKVITPSSSFNADLIRQIPRGECLDASKALAMDGLEDVDAESPWGQRLLRRRERVWIALFVLERGVCLARGRSYCVPKTPLIQHCDHWHFQRHSDLQDGPLVSMAALRRDLDELFANVRSRCDSYRVIDVGLKVAHEIERAIDEFFDKWLHTWTSVIGDFEHKTLPPYVEILVTHTRLSTYSMLLNHPSAPPEVKRSFRASAVSSALNVMRAAIQVDAEQYGYNDLLCCKHRPSSKRAGVRKAQQSKSCAQRPKINPRDCHCPRTYWKYTKPSQWRFSRLRPVLTGSRQTSTQHGHSVRDGYTAVCTSCLSARSWYVSTACGWHATVSFSRVYFGLWRPTTILCDVL